MPLLLSIETSTSVCSVAISRDKEILFYKENMEDRSHASSLAVFIDEGMKECELNYSDLDAVVVSKGPGSYTGLRIGVSTAKGICYGANIPLLSVSTLMSMACGVIDDKATAPDFQKAWFCPMIDAKRMEVFSAIFDFNKNQKQEIKAEIIDANSYINVLDDRPVYFFGDGAEKCKEVITHQNAKFIDSVYPSAKHMVPIAIELFTGNKFEDTAYFEPFYLKDFIATVPKKNIYK